MPDTGTKPPNKGDELKVKIEKTADDLSKAIQSLLEIRDEYEQLKDEIDKK